MRSPLRRGSSFTHLSEALHLVEVIKLHRPLFICALLRLYSRAADPTARLMIVRLALALAEDHDEHHRGAPGGQPRVANCSGNGKAPRVTPRPAIPERPNHG